MIMRGCERSAAVIRLLSTKGSGPQKHNGGKAFELGAPFPHRNQRLVFRRRSQERRRRINLFEITPNGQDLPDRGAVLQNECWHDASRIDRAVGIGVLFALGEIDRYQRQR